MESYAAACVKAKSSKTDDEQSLQSIDLRSMEQDLGGRDARKTCGRRSAEILNMFRAKQFGEPRVVSDIGGMRGRRVERKAQRDVPTPRQAN